MEATNYCRVVEMTHEDKVKMYNRLTKKELIEFCKNNDIDVNEKLTKKKLLEEIKNNLK